MLHLVELIIPFAAATLAVPGVAIMLTAYVRFRQPQFAAVLAVVSIAALYLALYAAFIVAGPFHVRLSVAAELERLSEVTLLLYLVALPAFLRTVSVRGRLFPAVNRILVPVGAVVAAAIATAAFVAPDLFVSMTRLYQPGAAPRGLWGAGVPGPLYRFRDVLMGALLVYSVVHLAAGLRGPEGRGVHLTFFAGFLAAVTGSLVAVVLNMVAAATGTVISLPFQAFESGLAIFAFLSYWSALQRFFTEAKQVQRLRSSLEGEVEQRRRAEAALLEHHVRLEEAVAARTRELERARDDLVRAEKLALLGQVTATVSHELRNPLGTVSNAVFSAGEAAGTCDHRRIEQAIATATRGLHRCVRILDQLADYAREWRPARFGFDPGVWLEEQARRLGTAHGLDLTATVERGLTVETDPELLGHALSRVVENAAHAALSDSARSRQVNICARACDGRLEIHVRDHGPGLDDEAHRRLFEPLFSTKTYGVGLGLSITLSIMKALGGGLELLRADPGTEVVLWVPGGAGRPSAVELAPGDRP
jgi:signal transduction histidine kinase